MANGSSVPPGYFALLVGIDAYPSKPLRGCVNDVVQVEQYLGTIGPLVQIQLLTAPTTLDSSTGPVDNGSTLPPTYTNVKSAVQRIITLAQPGDYVYIHFSGHGTRVRSSDEFSNQDTGDLALVLLKQDEEIVQERCLAGAELASWLKEMVDRELIVTLVLDCCFSAAVYRYDDPDVRYLPYDAVMNSKYTAELDVQPHNGPKRGARDASMTPNWLIDPDRCAILTACGPDQEAKELSNEMNQRRGILSFFLSETLQRYGGMKKKHKTIYHHLCAEIRDSGCRQHPILYGNKDQGFFGSRKEDGDLTLIAVSRTESGGLMLEAGAAHGVQIGDQLDLFLPELTQDSSSQSASPLTAIVDQVYSLTSHLEMSNKSVLSDEALISARISRRASYNSFLILLATDLIHLENLSNMLKARNFDTSRTGDEAQHFLHIAPSEDNYYQMMWSSNQPVINLPKLDQETTDLEIICDIIEHLARYEIVRRLTNENTMPSFRSSFDIHMTHAGDVHHPENAIAAKSGDMHQLVIQNKERQDLYIFVYNLGPSWQIENLLRATYEVLPPKDNAKGFTGFFKKRLKMMVSPAMIRNGQYECDDTIKVIVTTRPTSFDLLELPKLGQSPKKLRSKRSGLTDGSQMPEDWAVLSFHIHTASR